MNAHHRKSTTAFFDAHAKNWNARTYTEAQRKRIPEIVADLRIKPGDTVLDVGAGSGILIPFIRKAASETGRIIELDVSLNMLIEARRIHRSPKSLFIQADVENLPLKENCADCIVCFSVFPHFGYPLQALKELRRVVRTGGCLYILHLEGSESLNACHRNIGGHVQNDKLPGQEKMAELLETSNWRLEEIRDTSDEYYVRAC